MLLRIDVDDPELGIGAIPVRGDRVEDKPEILAGAWFEGRGRESLHIYIRFPCPDELELMGLVLDDLVGNVAEENLDGDADDGAGAVVGDVAVEVSDLASGQIGGLAHGEAGNEDVGRVWIEGGGGGHDGGPAFAVTEIQHQPDNHGHDYSGSDRDGQPIALFSFSGTD